MLGGGSDKSLVYWEPSKVNEHTGLTRRKLIASTLAATAMSLCGISLSVSGATAVRLSKRNAAGLAGISQVRLGSVAVACLTERKRQITVGGGFRSKGSASQASVQTTVQGLSDADFQAAADAAYEAVSAGLVESGIDVLDNSALIAALKERGDPQPNGKEYAFPEGNKQSSTALLYGASAFGGYVPLPDWTPIAPGLAGIGSTGLVMTANKVAAFLGQQAEDDGVPIICVLIGISPVRIEAEFGSDWRVPDAFGNGGLARTGTLSTETGLSSHPLLTKMEVFPGKGKPAQVNMQDEIGIQGGIGTLEDTTDGVTRAAQGLGNALSLLGGGGRESKTTRYTLTADTASYVAGAGALASDVTTALAGGFS